MPSPTHDGRVHKTCHDFPLIILLRQSAVWLLHSKVLGPTDFWLQSGRDHVHVGIERLRISRDDPR
jgi:hypothetical protein